MNIRARLTLRFSIIVASILLLFSIAIFTVSAEYRQEEFYDRLERRAITTARLLVTVEEVDKNLLRIIDQNSVPALPEEKILVFEKDNSLAYSSVDDPEIDISEELLNRIRKEGQIRFAKNTFEYIGILYKQGDEEFVAVAYAFDRYGRRKLGNLRTILVTGLLIGIGIIVLAGRLFAGQVLEPLANMNRQVSKISAGNLGQLIDEGNQRDEIALLAMNFNRMLNRLQAAFDVQQSFVSNASHELRTPLAAMRSQLEVVLAKERKAEDYRQVLHSLLDYTKTLVELTNGLLLLAKSGMDSQRLHFKNVRIDETLFFSQEELAKHHPSYHFQLDYDTLPENESDLTIRGNEQLLTTAFINFIDNACKFSPDHTVYISLANRRGNIEIRFRDNGIGIPENEKDKIFAPFYRGVYSQSAAKGHGIGLSLCRRIVELHEGSIEIESTPETGSVFIVKLPTITS